MAILVRDRELLDLFGAQEIDLIRDVGIAGYGAILRCSFFVDALSHHISFADVQTKRKEKRRSNT
jgi:hypothetical protein